MMMMKKNRLAYRQSLTWQVEDEKAGAAKQLQAAQSAAERQGSDMAQLRKELESCRKGQCIRRRFW